VASGFLIGLREGVEAALLIGVSIAYLVGSGRRDRLSWIWLGTLAAILASLGVGALLVVTVGELPPPYEQAFEAGAMFVAAVIVTWMLFWMRRRSRTLRGELQAQLGRALDTDAPSWLAILAFVSVIREGIETVLFSFGQIAAAGSTPGAVLDVVGGTAVGVAASAVIGYAIYRGSRRINLGTFFSWTGLLLVFLAAGLLSRGVHELVEIGVIPFGTQAAFDLAPLLPDASGLAVTLHALVGYVAQPEVVVVGAYVGYLVPVLVAFIGVRRLRELRIRPARANGRA
jgi:high-affinity iron transporter